jgi:hypothetical protein
LESQESRDFSHERFKTEVRCKRSEAGKSLLSDIRLPASGLRFRGGRDCAEQDCSDRKIDQGAGVALHGSGLTARVSARRISSGSSSGGSRLRPAPTTWARAAWWRWTDACRSANTRTRTARTAPLRKWWQRTSGFLTARVRVPEPCREGRRAIWAMTFRPAISVMDLAVRSPRSDSRLLLGRQAHHKRLRVEPHAAVLQAGPGVVWRRTTQSKTGLEGFSLGSF